MKNYRKANDMEYLIPIKTAFFTFPFIALLFTIPFILHQYHKYGSINKLRVLIIYSFILYMLTIYFLVILPLPDRDEVLYKDNMIKLIPFGFINDFIKESSLVLTNPSTYLSAIKEPCFYTVVFNIFMTMPFGMYLRYYFKCSLKKTLFYGFLLSLFFELTQLTGLYYIYDFPYRIFDVDDLMMNTLGTGIGYFLIGLILKYLPTRDKIDEKALKIGQKVTGLRRVVLFFLDLFNYSLILLFISIFFKNNYLKGIIFVIYYILIPYILNGRTLGCLYLNVQLEYYNYKLLRIIFRNIFIYTYYFLIPYYSLFWVSYLKLTNTVLINMFFILLLFLFYTIHLITILKKTTIYYDNIIKVKFKSTIKIN